MTREQQMMDAADRYADEVCDESCTGAQVAEIINDFCAGWRAADSHPHWIPVEKTNNTINVFFRKEQDGWHTYTQYGIDLPTCTAIEFGEHISKAVNLLNGKEVTNE